MYIPHFGEHNSLTAAPECLGQHSTAIVQEILTLSAPEYCNFTYFLCNVYTI